MLFEGGFCSYKVYTWVGLCKRGKFREGEDTRRIHFGVNIRSVREWVGERERKRSSLAPISSLEGCLVRKIHWFKGGSRNPTPDARSLVRSCNSSAFSLLFFAHTHTHAPVVPSDPPPALSPICSREKWFLWETKDGLKSIRLKPSDSPFLSLTPVYIFLSLFLIDHLSTSVRPILY